MNRCRFDTYCGIYCGACEIINAQTVEDKNRVIDLFKSKTSNWQATLDQMHCRGCKTDDSFINCRNCPILACAQQQNVEFCFECPEYPCAHHERFKRASDQALKHLRFNKLNLEYIRKHGVEKWLAEQDASWRCPDCGERFTWYSETCRKCGKALSR